MITPTIVLEQPPTINSAPKTAEVVVPQSQANEDEPSTTGVKASEDYRYKKYFKMIHFGVPQQAVKNKLISEGLDPSILEWVENKSFNWFDFNVFFISFTTTPTKS